MVAVLVCGVPIGEIAAEAGVPAAESHRELYDALDRACDIYGGRTWLPKWIRRAGELAERHVGMLNN